MSTDALYLQNFPCFHELTGEQLEAIAEITDAVCYLPGQVLFEEGKPGEHLLFLAKGQVEVLYNIGEAGQVRVDAVSSDEVMGCSALVEPYTYTATGRSQTEVEILEINAAALRDLMQKDCPLGFSLQQHILRVLMDRVLDLRLRAAS